MKIDIERSNYLIVGSHDVLGQLHVLEHALELEREDAAALLLELGEHALLGVDGGALADEQALGQVLLVEGLEDVLAVYEAKEDHDLVEYFVELLLGGLLVADAQLVVDVLGDELGGLVGALVDEVLEGVLERVRELLVVGPALAGHVQLLLEVDELLYHHVVLLRIDDYLASALLDVLTVGGLELLDAVEHARYQLIEQLEVGQAVLVEHLIEALVQYGCDMLADQVLLETVDERVARRAVQVVRLAARLLAEALLHVLQIVGHVEHVQQLLALARVQLLARPDERELERRLIELHFVQHGQEALDEAPIDPFARALALNQRQHAVDAARLHDAIGGHVALVELEAHVPYGHDERVVEHVAAVECQEDLTYHGHVRRVVEPVGVEQLEVLDRIVHGRDQLRQIAHNVLLAHLLQRRVQVAREALGAQVLHVLVEDLEARLDLPVVVNGSHRLLQRRPQLLEELIANFRNFFFRCVFIVVVVVVVFRRTRTM